MRSLVLLALTLLAPPAVSAATATPTYSLSWASNLFWAVTSPVLSACGAGTRGGALDAYAPASCWAVLAPGAPARLAFAADSTVLLRNANARQAVLDLDSSNSHPGRMTYEPANAK